jgi:division/cell wall cluster transcriptional repressor MraZ
MTEPKTTLTPFLGRYVYGVDSARRVMFPSAWRPKDRNTVFMAMVWPLHKQECLVVLPPSAWQAVVAKIVAGELSNEEAAILERTVASTSAELRFDRFWRLTLPEPLMTAVGITNQVQFVGRLNKFELWAPDRFQTAATMDRLAAAETARRLGI